MFRILARCLTLRTGGVLPLRVVRIRQPTAVALVRREYTSEKTKYDTAYYDGVCRDIMLFNSLIRYASFVTCSYKLFINDLAKNS